MSYNPASKLFFKLVEQQQEDNNGELVIKVEAGAVTNIETPQKRRGQVGPANPNTESRESVYFLRIRAKLPDLKIWRTFQKVNIKQQDDYIKNMKSSEKKVEDFPTRK